MFSSIYKYELKFWFKQPSTYFYALFFFFVPCVAIWGMASESNFDRTGEIINSASNIIDFSIRRFFLLMLFILPGIMGLSIFRDYKSRMHLLLYSFPFNKRDYLFAKFGSAFTVTAIVGLMVLLGFSIGFKLSESETSHLLPFDPLVYLQAYFVFILPNLFFFGILIFGVVTFTRNIYVGYISVVILILARQIIGAIVSKLDSDFLMTLLEPVGVNAYRYTTRLWTLAEKNHKYLPLDEFIVYNRLFWFLLAVGISVWVYRSFSFSQNRVISRRLSRPTTISRRRTKKKPPFPTINLNFSIKQQLKTTLKLAWIDFKYIVGNWMFISIVIIGCLAVVFILSNANPMFGTKALPITAHMLNLPMMFFSGIINLLTFLYVGMLIHRSKLAKSHQLVDISPWPNWVFLCSKIIAITMMQVVLLSMLMFGGILNQVMNAYYHFEIGHYIFELYGLNLIHFFIWTCLAVFIQSIFDNPYLGFFILILLVVGMIFIGEPMKIMGFPALAEPCLHYNQVPGPPPSWLMYSDMDGYGMLLEIYLTYKAYWFLAALLLLVGSILVWQRGLTYSISERIQFVKSRINRKLVLFTSLISILFLGTGYQLFQDSYYSAQQLSEGERKQIFRHAEKKYERYNKFPQPVIKAVKMNMDIFPKTRDFTANGIYTVVNETNVGIDSLILSFLPDVNTDYDLDQPYHLVSHENVADYINIDILKLEQALQPGDSLSLSFSCKNNPNSFMHRSSLVKGNGTYIEDDIFLQFGNWFSYIREENEWSTHKMKAHPSDSTAWYTKNQHFIDFEATLSTSMDQIAIAPGKLIEEWIDGKRKYYRYKVDHPIAHAFLFMSGDYALQEEDWNGVDLQVYYHKDHPYNIDRILAGQKAGLAYCSSNFSPYPFQQMRTVEFSQTGSASAHSFPTTIPTGEGTGFIADIDDSEDGGTDFAFGTSVHETAHQWWGNMLQPVDVLGRKMVVESIAEYVNVMVKKHEKGEKKMRSYLHENMDIYLRGRTFDRAEEQPLMYTYPNQNYIHYPKGAVVFYALSDYIGEENLNRALSKYIDQVEQQKIPATSIAMVDLIREETPDSLAYIIEDMFETITIYDNRVKEINLTVLPNGQYQIDINFLVSKYRNTGKGERVFTNTTGDLLSHKAERPEASMTSYPLQDYIEIGIFTEQEIDGKTQETVLYLTKHKITSIQNHLSIIVDQKPTSAGVDPYIKLIDLDKSDNRRAF